MSALEHSPPPWRIESAHDAVYLQFDNQGWEYAAEIRHRHDATDAGIETDRQRAAHIVQCINAHDALVEALTKIVAMPLDEQYSAHEMRATARAALHLAHQPKE